jgi:hypothetical protein
MLRKLVCLTGCAPQHLYFLNTIHRVCPVALAVIQVRGGGAIRRSWRRLRAVRASGSRIRWSARVPLNLRDRAAAATCDRILGDAWCPLDPEIPVLLAGDVNGHDVVARLEAEAPDLLLDHGGALVSSQVLACAPLALNLHWGLSPWYRGTRCTEWALLNWDPRNIGVTIHRLTARIDGGAIVAQARARIDAADTVTSINLQLSRLGTELMVRILGQLAQGRPLRFVEQDPNAGTLRLERHWSPELRRHLGRLLRRGALTRMLARPACLEEYPLVRLEADREAPGDSA